MVIYGTLLLVGCSPSEPSLVGGSSQPLAYALVDHISDGGDLKEENKSEGVSVLPQAVALM